MRWLLAVMALAIHAGAVVHTTVVAHIRCEHGELVEIGERDSVLSSESVGPDEIESGGHHHEHCLAARIGGNRPSVSRVIVEAPRATEVVSCEGRERDAADQRRLCLRVAPKASPPHPSV